MPLEARNSPQDAFSYQDALEALMEGKSGFKPLEKSMEALKFRIAKRPENIVHADLGYTYAGCPFCKKPVWSNEKYCPKCGQCLDWSDENNGFTDIFGR